MNTVANKRTGWLDQSLAVRRQNLLDLFKWFCIVVLVLLLGAIITIVGAKLIGFIPTNKTTPVISMELPPQKDLNSKTFQTKTNIGTKDGTKKKVLSLKKNTAKNTAGHFFKKFPTVTKQLVTEAESVSGVRNAVFVERKWTKQFSFQGYHPPKGCGYWGHTLHVMKVTWKNSSTSKAFLCSKNYNSSNKIAKLEFTYKFKGR